MPADGAGQVVEVGEQVTLFKVGDRVVPFTTPGFHAGESASQRLIDGILGFGQDGMARGELPVSSSRRASFA
jgi:NADPH:quinone reductase-like Zn-dependent oxidoreductase